MRNQIIKYLFLQLSVWLTVEAIKRGKRRKYKPERPREIHRLNTCEEQSTNTSLVASNRHEHPWVTYLIFIGKKRKQCTGSLIHPKLVLTAGHCCRGYNQVELTFGEYDLHEEWNPMRFKMESKKLFIHPRYNSTYMMNGVKWPSNFDACIIRLGNCVRPVCLPSDRLVDYDLCWGAGWGRTRFSHPNNLVQYHLHILPREYCLDKSIYNNNDIQLDQFCAGQLDENEDGLTDSIYELCRGGSGGPLVCDINGTAILSGTVSWNAPGGACSEPGKPGIFQDVLSLVPWIEEHIAQLHKTPIPSDIPTPNSSTDPDTLKTVNTTVSGNNKTTTAPSIANISNTTETLSTRNTTYETSTSTLTVSTSFTNNSAVANSTDMQTTTAPVVISSIKSTTVSSTTTVTSTTTIPTTTTSTITTDALTPQPIAIMGIAKMISTIVPTSTSSEPTVTTTSTLASSITITNTTMTTKSTTNISSTTTTVGNRTITTAVASTTTSTTTSTFTSNNITEHVVTPGVTTPMKATDPVTTYSSSTHQLFSNTITTAKSKISKTKLKKRPKKTKPKKRHKKKLQTTTVTSTVCSSTSTSTNSTIMTSRPTTTTTGIIPTITTTSIPTPTSVRISTSSSITSTTTNGTSSTTSIATEKYFKKVQPIRSEQSVTTKSTQTVGEKSDDSFAEINAIDAKPLQPKSNGSLQTISETMSNSFKSKLVPKPSLYSDNLYSDSNTDIQNVARDFCAAKFIIILLIFI